MPYRPHAEGAHFYHVARAEWRPAARNLPFVVRIHVRMADERDRIDGVVLSGNDPRRFGHRAGERKMEAVIVHGRQTDDHNVQALRRGIGFGQDVAQRAPCAFERERQVERGVRIDREPPVGRARHAVPQRTRARLEATGKEGVERRVGVQGKFRFFGRTTRQPRKGGNRRAGTRRIVIVPENGRHQPRTEKDRPKGAPQQRLVGERERLVAHDRLRHAFARGAVYELNRVHVRAKARWAMSLR